MPYADEDEIDWSDGPLDPPTPDFIEPTAVSSHLNTTAGHYDDQDSLFESDTERLYSIPCGLPLDPASLNGKGGPGRLQRARTGVQINRRVPSKVDYVNFALYQANQKAYEATFIKNFVAHALHPDQINACFQVGLEARASLEKYMRQVSGQVSVIARKMAWNAHFRVTHLLASDGWDGAPFLDVQAIKSNVISDFGPDNFYQVSPKMSGSWHRAFPEPAMVRFTTQDYRLESGYTMPLEEIDEVADTLLDKNAFVNSLPAGRAFRPPTSKKRKGQYAPGAAVREERNVAPRGNWLSFALLNTPAEPHTPPSKTHISKDVVVGAKKQDVAEQDPSTEDLGNTQHNDFLASSSAGPSQPCIDTPALPDTWFEELFGSYGANVLDCDRVDSPNRSDSIEHVEKVLSWRMRLIDDHKRRLTQKWGNPPQILEKALPGIKQAIASALAQDIRPIARDYQKTVRIIALREQRQHGVFDRLDKEDVVVTTKTAHPTKRSNNRLEVIPEEVESTTSLTHGSSSPVQEEHTAPSRESKGKGRAVNATETLLEMSVEPPKKKRKTDHPTAKQASTRPPTKQKKKVVKSPTQSASSASSKSPVDRQPLPPHPSGSKTLEPHQQLPPNAYFQPDSIDEKHAWRCGAKHAMGHYYNAGDRKNCRGCNTSLSGNPNIVQMDFYLPSRSLHYQPAPGMIWKPNKPSANPRKSDRPCHNGIAKDAYWAAINNGATGDEARQIGVNAIVEFLKPKPPPKAPTPEPTPEPEPDLGPHPSGSATMEHGQELPICAYKEKKERHEELAWRCDVNHALGRYYLAGDKKSCPGCGSNKDGVGKHAIMDFYMEPGATVRQEAPHLVKWKPRKYKARSNSKSVKAKVAAQTHSQMCAEKYFQAIDEGHEDEEAMRLAIEATDAQLDGKQEEMTRKHEEQDEDRDDEESLEVGEASTQSSHSRNDSDSSSSSTTNACRRNSRGGCTMPSVSRKQNINDLEDDELDEVEVYQTAGDMDAASSSHEVIEISSAEEESSGSDSE